MENYGNCGQYSSSEDEWWGSMGECRASNVAYSLYGILKGDASIWRGSACSKSTFINSFFTMDGLYNFVEASKGKVSDTYNYPYCSEYSGNDDWNNWRRLSNSGSGDGEVDAYSTMGCSSSGRFVWDVFNGDTCFGANYLYTADPLYDFNESLENHMQCKLIFKKGHVDFATNLLSYSQTCHITGEYKDFCPDPHGVLLTYEYNFAVSAKHPNYKASINKQYGLYQNDFSSPSDVRLLKSIASFVFFSFGGLFFLLGFYLRYTRDRTTLTDHDDEKPDQRPRSQDYKKNSRRFQRRTRNEAKLGRIREDENFNPISLRQKRSFTSKKMLKFNENAESA